MLYMHYFFQTRIKIMAFTLLFFVLSCSGEKKEPVAKTEDLKSVASAITADDLLGRIRVLASDAFEGRAPGTRGETLTLNYLISELKKTGLSPGNPDGSYVQNVRLAAIKGNPSVTFSAGSQTLHPEYPEDYVAVSRHSRRDVTIKDSDLVFVGYGIVAPEFEWDDYKGVDVKGKTVLMLINDPPVPDPSNPQKLDEKIFGGKIMTYYGRWTYKFEEAARKGAAAAILVHETRAAGYPYGVLIRSWGRENFTIEKSGNRENRLPVEAWITTKTANKLFEASGKNFESLKRSAKSRDFKPVPIGATASFTVKNTIRRIQSQNVIAMLEGSDPKLKSEYLLYTAHWDHLGKNERLKGDQVYNGAVDNASGTAGLLEIARAYARLSVRPRRSVLFLASTAEEKGLLGAAYYAENPLYPLNRTLANINLDCLNPWGRTRDIIIIGQIASFLDEIARDVAKSQGRRIEPELEPEQGFFYRSDQFEFAKRGIPALYTDAGIDLVGKPAEYGRRKRDEYTRRDYHKLTDEIKPDWDLRGAVEDLQFLFMVGYKIAQNTNDELRITNAGF